MIIMYFMKSTTLLLLEMVGHYFGDGISFSEVKTIVTVVCMRTLRSYRVYCVYTTVGSGTVWTTACGG
jgi:hypothetical protein